MNTLYVFEGIFKSMRYQEYVIRVYIHILTLRDLSIGNFPMTRSVCLNFKFHFQCAYRSTCYSCE